MAALHGHCEHALSGRGVDAAAYGIRYIQVLPDVPDQASHDSVGSASCACVAEVAAGGHISSTIIGIQWLHHTVSYKAPGLWHSQESSMHAISRDGVAILNLPI